MRDLVVNLNLHGNRFMPPELDHQGTAVGEVQVGRVMCNGLTVKPHDW
jgi:hypothetical protein